MFPRPKGGGTDAALKSEKWSSRRRVAGKYCVICEKVGVCGGAGGEKEKKERCTGVGDISRRC